MQSFKVQYVPKKFTPVKILHLAMQSYLNFFSSLALQDKKNKLPQEAYENAATIKHTDNSMLGKYGNMFSPASLLPILYSLSWYSHFLDMNIGKTLQKHQLNDKAMFSFEATVDIMFSVSAFINSRHLRKIIEPAKDTLQDCPIPKKLVHDLVATMNGKKASNKED